MAYIATKATYIGEEEVKDENGKPIVDTNGKPVKRIKTDVDDVIFTEGEVIVLIEAIKDGKHFDLEIEDKGSTYFAPTQIKIGDGMHSFGELNWLQTIDDFRVKSIIDKQIATYKTNVDKIYETFTNGVNAKIGEQNVIISNFVNYQSKEILKEIVNNNYFRITSSGGLIGFTNDSTIHIGKSCIGIGSNNQVYGNISNTSDLSAYSVAIGNKNVSTGIHNFIFGNNNHIQGDFNTVVGEDNNLVTIGEVSKHYYCFINGYSNNATGDYSCVGGYLNYAGGYSLVHGKSCNRSGTRGKYTACFGEECNTKKDYTFSCGYMCSSNASKSFTCGSGNVTNGECSFSCGRTNRSNGNYSFTCGLSNSTDSIDGAFACGKYNIKDGKLFSIGKGTDANHLANIFDIDTSGKATFYGDLEIKGQIVDNMQFINKTDFNKLKEQVNNIVITSTGDGNATLEVASARVGLNNINYNSLSDRLDADFEKCVSKLQLESAIQEALTIDDLEISGGIINSNRGNSIYNTDGNRKGLLAMGEDNTASGTYSIAIGLNNTTSGTHSMTMGFKNTASGSCSTATGGNNTSSGDSSVAMGAGNKAIAQSSIAMGSNNTSSGQLSMAIGSENKADREYSVAIGRQNTASSNNSVAIGSQNTASGHLSMAIGSSNKAYGTYSIALGENSITSGLKSVAMGTGLITIGDYQTALGKFNVDETESDMRNLFVLGNGTDASNRSNAMTVDWEGNLGLSGGITNLNSSNSVSGENGSHGLIAMGEGNTASGFFSVALGGGNTASGGVSIAMGGGNTASGTYSVAMGQGNTANVDNQTVIGRYNTPNSTEEGPVQHAFIIGNGTGVSNRSNAMTVDWNGNLNVSGNVTATMTDGSTISLIDIYSKIGLIEEQLASLVTPEGTA